MSMAMYDCSLLSVTLTAGTEDSEYPIENLTDGHPRRPFRTTTPSCTLEIEESGQGAALALIATNVDSVSVGSVISAIYSWGYDETESIIAAGEDETGAAITFVDDTETGAVSVTESRMDLNSGIYFVKFEGTSGGTRTITLELQSMTESYVSIGLLVVGSVMQFRDLAHDSFSETSDDKGTEVEQNDGSVWYKPVRVLRQPSGHIMMWNKPDSVDPDGYNSYWEFMSNIWIPQGKSPRLWVFSENGATQNLYAMISQPPTAVMGTPNHKLVALSFKEVI